MKISLGEIKAAEPALRKLVSLDIPVKTSFIIGKVIKEVDAELTHYENERVKLVRKYGEEDPDGNVTVTTNYQPFFEELSALTGIEVALKYEPVSVDALGEIKMTPVEMAQLEKFIV